VASDTSRVDAGQVALGRTADRYLTIPLATLAPEDYLLKVETTLGARCGARHTIRREAVEVRLERTLHGHC
jgi:hypothetical protein